MKIVVENSTWNNVGDGWYQYSLYYLLKKIFPNYQVEMGEGPIKRAFKIKKRKHLDNALNLLEWEKGDVHVFSGPIIDQILSTYSNKIKEIKRRGAQYALISVSSANDNIRSRVNKAEVIDFFQKYPPLFFSSRDESTYNQFNNCISNVYNGICTAFLVDKVIKIEDLNIDQPYFISSFYREHEPLFKLEGSSFSIENLLIIHRKNRFGLPHSFARHLNHTLPQQKEIGGRKIVRVIQDLNTKYNHINFAMPNSFISFNPLSYLKIIKSSEFVVSDRIHACATSLAFGKPARLLINSPRSGIFDRLRIDYTTNNGIIYPQSAVIEDEMGKLVFEIKKYF